MLIWCKLCRILFGYSTVSNSRIIRLQTFSRVTLLHLFWRLANPCAMSHLSLDYLLWSIPRLRVVFFRLWLWDWRLSFKIFLFFICKYLIGVNCIFFLLDRIFSRLFVFCFEVRTRLRLFRSDLCFLDFFFKILSIVIIVFLNFLRLLDFLARLIGDSGCWDFFCWSWR